MSIFTKNIEELIPIFKTTKVRLKEFLYKNLKINTHFIEYPYKKTPDEIKKGSGGHNKIVIMLTEEAFELVKNTFNFRINNITNVSNNVKVVKLLPCIETQTIGFIQNTYMNCTETIRQFYIGIYRVDLYFPHHKIIVECDEFGHIQYDKENEIKREQYLLSLGNVIIRYNPNEKDFCLSVVLNKINRVIMKNNIL